jgi:hypothetical protein
MLNLKIHHIVHLTQEQRYALHNGEEHIVVGVSVPVWDRNRNTTEPAKEVFCLYHLKNTKSDSPLKILSYGYEIDLPYKENKTTTLSDEVWRDWHMSHPDKLDEYYEEKYKNTISSQHLLDPADGGHASMCYREHNEMKRQDELWKIDHFVNIVDMTYLTNSLCAI